MSSDFNPSKNDQPDFVKDEIQSARTGFGLLLLACFTMGQSIAAFSRIPGTAGAFFVMAQLVCLVAYSGCYEPFVQSTGKPDPIGLSLPVTIQLIWFCVTIVATYRWRSKGFEAAPSQPGVGILYRWMPEHSLSKVNLASDLTIGVPLVAICFLLDSPILGYWLLTAMFALIFTHLWMDWIERTELQRIKNASRRAQQWISKLKRSRWS